VARIAPLSRDEAEPRIQTVLGRLPPLKVFGTVANAQGSFVNWLRLGADCLDASLFNPVLRELAILRVARMTPGAEYEWVQHVPILLAVGGTREQVAALEADDLEADALGDDGRLMVSFTSQIVNDATPDADTFGQMSARFTNGEIVQAILVIGHYMTLGRIMATAQIDLDQALGGDVLGNVEELQARRAQRDARA